MGRRTFFIVGVFLAFLVVAEGCGHKPMAPLQLRGVWHKVETGDTILSVAKRYGADLDAMVELNDLPPRGAMPDRKEVFVPKQNGKPAGTGAPPPRRTPSTSTLVAGNKGNCSRSKMPCLKWPVKGKVSSSFGQRSNGHHDGIDIAATRGTPIGAAEAGKVLYSGSEIKGYGNLVIISHENKMITVYAHNDKNLVKEGDTVLRGQTVARIGRSGSATGNHLHFEVRMNEQPKNPLLYLP